MFEWPFLPDRSWSSYLCEFCDGFPNSVVCPAVRIVIMNFGCLLEIFKKKKVAYRTSPKPRSSDFIILTQVLRKEVQVCSFRFVTLARTGVAWEEGTSIVKMSPADWPVDMPPGYFIDELLVWMGSNHCGWVHPRQAGGPGLYERAGSASHKEQISK